MTETNDNNTNNKQTIKNEANKSQLRLLVQIFKLWEASAW